MKFRQRYSTDLAGDAQFSGEVDHRLPGYPGQAVIGMRRDEDRIVHHEYIGGVRFRHKPIQIQHQCVGGVGQIGLNLWQNVVDHVVVMDLGIDGRGTVPSSAGGDEGDALGVVVGRRPLGRFPFRQNDEGGTVHVEIGIHARGALLSSCKGETHVRSVPHAVGGQSSKYRLHNLLLGVDVLKSQRLGRLEQPLQMPVELEHLAVVDAQPLPRGIAPLHGRIPRTDARLTPRKEPPSARRTDVDQNVLVAGIFVDLRRRWTS
mmetsp:Transcript_22813/g.65793  ORF Transcript_22813/g.65793 Transcript_22813/m.65793 type:complete len:261 (+) Transcript_22813:2138-2920(+)